jgi:hypothetical protein
VGEDGKVEVKPGDRTSTCSVRYSSLTQFQTISYAAKPGGGATRLSGAVPNAAMSLSIRRLVSDVPSSMQGLLFLRASVHVYRGCTFPNPVRIYYLQKPSDQCSKILISLIVVMK